MTFYHSSSAVTFTFRLVCVWVVCMCESVSLTTKSSEISTISHTKGYRCFENNRNHPQICVGIHRMCAVKFKCWCWYITTCTHTHTRGDVFAMDFSFSFICCNWKIIQATSEGINKELMKGEGESLKAIKRERL